MTKGKPSAFGHIFCALDESLAPPPYDMDMGIGRVVEQFEGPFDTAAEKFLAEHNATRVSIEGGSSSLCYVASPFTHYHSDGSLHVVFQGEVGRWPGHLDLPALNESRYVTGEPALSEAELLAQLYSSFNDTVDTEDVLEESLVALSKMEGSFSFVLHDGARKRVLVGRSHCGGLPLHWGIHSGRLMISSDPENLALCEPAATEFPAGTLYTSRSNILLASNPGDKGFTLAGPGNWPGLLFSFVPSTVPGREWRPIKSQFLVDAAGTLQGQIFKVSSESEMRRTAA